MWGGRVPAHLEYYLLGIIVADRKVQELKAKRVGAKWAQKAFGRGEWGEWRGERGVSAMRKYEITASQAGTGPGPPLHGASDEQGVQGWPAKRWAAVV